LPCGFEPGDCADVGSAELPRNHKREKIIRKERIRVWTVERFDIRLVSAKGTRKAQLYDKARRETGRLREEISLRSGR
jgi:hypothetical protein